MDFKHKINTQRQFYPSKTIQSSVESDRGRIINSAAIRRLQQKTQVFPLERNAAVRSRLTHSLEVQQVGRFIVQQIVQTMRKLKQGNQGFDDYGFCALERSAESLVEMACLMHDIGNPPFGHFGERAISDWFGKAVQANSSNKLDALVAMPKQMQNDLLCFEGNAQAIRLLCSLLKLNLSYSQIAAVFKYTRPGEMTATDIPKEMSYLMKKPGYYLSEQGIVEQMQQALEMKPGCRHPLTYIMEAADDISYCIADIEDAVEKGLLTVELLITKLSDCYIALGGDMNAPVDDYGNAFAQLLNKAKERYDKESIDQINQFFVNLRVSINHVLVKHAVKRFVDNLEAIYHGRFNGALLEDGSAAHQLAESLKTVATKYVFSNKEVQQKELRGYRTIQGLLDYYQPLLQLSSDEFRALMAGDRQTVKLRLIESRLVGKLPGKHKRAYQEALARLDDSRSEFVHWEFYYRCRLMQDFVSGMTDQYAHDEYRSLMVFD